MMTIERGEAKALAPAAGAKEGAVKAGRFLGSLKDVLLAASRDELPASAATSGITGRTLVQQAVAPPLPMVAAAKANEPAPLPVTLPAIIPRAEDAARLARTMPAPRAADRHSEPDAPTTRVVRRESPTVAESNNDRTVLLRGRQKIERAKFERDPVVGFLIVVGGRGLGAFRPIFEGNNTVGRATSNRIAIDFGDDTISSEAQAYLRYDATDRSFLFVPNLAKTNVVSVNDKRPAGAVELKAMDVITLGRTQVALLPFCGADFDWSEISESKT